MLHPALKSLDLTVLFVVQSAIDGLVKTARRKVGLNAHIDGLRTVLVKPRIQLFQLRRCERPYSAFNFLNGVQTHVSGSKKS